MSTYFTSWHWIAVAIFTILFFILTLMSLKEKNTKNILSMIFASFLVLVTAGAFTIMALDKYTKKATLYGVKNTRILRNETIVFTGFVKNKGDFTIGEITLTVKLVNKGHVTGNVKGGSFYKPSGFMEFFSGGFGISSKPQTITKKFVVAKNLQPGEAKDFRVYFKFPPYFRNTAEFAKVYGH